MALHWLGVQSPKGRTPRTRAAPLPGGGQLLKAAQDVGAQAVVPPGEPQVGPLGDPPGEPQGGPLGDPPGGLVGGVREGRLLGPQRGHPRDPAGMAAEALPVGDHPC